MPFGQISCGCAAALIQPAFLCEAQAADRLRASIGFNRADPAPLNALGDVRMAQVRCCREMRSRA